MSNNTKTPEGNANERKKEPTPPPKSTENESSSSKEMCAYCDAATTVSSKFYNISTVGDLEYIGRRSNHLGPKKHTFCDRVCKRHYDLNLKRDKAQRQFNAKRERLPGIDVIFGFTKKARTDSHPGASPSTHAQPHAHPSTANMGEFSAQVTSYNNHWQGKMSPVPGVQGGPMVTTMATGPPVVTMVKPQQPEKWKVEDWQIHTSSWRAVQQPNPAKEPDNSFARSQVAPVSTSTPTNNEGTLKFQKWEKPKQSPDASSSLQASASDKANDSEMDDKAKDNYVALFDCILQQMMTLLALFPVDQGGLRSSFLKTRQELASSKTDITAAIASLYSEANRTIQAFLQSKEEQQSKINSSVNDLMVLLLKREKSEYLLQDNDVNAIFIDWVELQKRNVNNSPSPQNSSDSPNENENQINNTDNPANNPLDPAANDTSQ
eukprot:TRINITY_DN18300_c0_g1_i1.p1 TRINITY_DN18300_c0_g1~~TRINITY_DN18300_c0_g1_i1.p1  ORF type:complete len:435 (+),score=104.23 TRINITY_DN18300_c0_g1_i1:116-1420(+)